MRSERRSSRRTVDRDRGFAVEHDSRSVASETGLPEGASQGERPHDRPVAVLADHIEKGEYLDRRLDAALPDRQPAPRPEIRLIQRPIGPVGVLGASNFPLAFSTAGGDTAAALAARLCLWLSGAGSAHPGTGEIVAQAIEAAIRKTVSIRGYPR